MRGGIGSRLQSPAHQRVRVGLHGSHPTAKWTGENMERKLTITTHQAQAEADRAYWRSRTPEERLDAVEHFRLQAGKFLYEYPARLRRLLEVIRSTPR